MVKVLNKKDIALSKLETAIDLFMNDKDLVSSYSLAAASAEILREIWRKDVGEIGILMPFDVMLEELSKGKDKHTKDLIWNKNNKIKNFFKHAKSDTNESIEYNEDVLPFVIWDAITTYSDIYKKTEKSFTPFLGWFLSTNKIFANAKIMKNIKPMIDILQIKEKKDFIELPNITT